MSDTPQLYYDEQRKCWMVDDNGRARQATPEEIDTYVNSMPNDDHE